MQASQARTELAAVIIDSGPTADDTVLEVFEKLDEIRRSPDVPYAVHDSAEFLAWLRS